MIITINAFFDTSYTLVNPPCPVVVSWLTELELELDAELDEGLDEELDEELDER